MENSPNVFTDAGQSILSMDGVPQSRAYWPMARAAHVDLHVMSMRRVNVLLMGTDAVIEDALSRLMPNLRGPIQTWTPADPLDLPSPAQSGTLILREVGALHRVDQYRLLKWLEMCGGRTQVVSTTTAPLIALVEAGAFHDTLYYRLNVVCVDVTT
jgi:transcriptional regulator of acetoin/glycerol metabolism